MNPNPETIEMYIADAKNRILMSESDIKAYEHKIYQTKREVETQKWLIEQYIDALKKIGVANEKTSEESS